MSSFISVNPFTEQELSSYPTISNQHLEKVLEQANNAQKLWSKTSFEQRSKLFLTLASLIKQNVDSLAELATLEMGKIIAEGKAEVLKCARGCEFYAEHSAQILAPQITKIENGKEVHVLYEPMGIVLGIFPWNFPYWQIIRSATPVLMGGNAMLIKPSPNVPQCALALQKLFNEAGFSSGIVQTIFADEEQITTIIADKRVKACTLTGSEKAGSIVASTAAKYIKKSVLELGGSDPFIVLPDADIDLAVEQAIVGRFQNNGQSCIAAKRFILSAKIADEFTLKLIKKVSELKMGNPSESSIQIGPIARKDLRDKLASQVDKSLEQGAKIIFQSSQKMDKGFFYPPTILSNIRKGSVAYEEELFGTVLSVFIVNNEDEAIELANDTSFGLGASIWTKNLQQAKIMASKIQTGNVYVNAIVKSDPRFPFGGIKSSGFGRELGEQGLKEFCNTKTLMI